MTMINFNDLTNRAQLEIISKNCSTNTLHVASSSQYPSVRQLVAMDMRTSKETLNKMLQSEEDYYTICAIIHNLNRN